MPAYDPEVWRRGFERYLNLFKGDGLTVNSWTKRSKIKEGTLRGFLKGSTRSMTLETYHALAEARGHDVVEFMLILLGKQPPKTCAVADNPVRTELQSLQRDLHAIDSRITSLLDDDRVENLL